MFEILWWSSRVILSVGKRTKLLFIQLVLCGLFSFASNIGLLQVFVFPIPPTRIYFIPSWYNLYKMFKAIKASEFNPVQPLLWMT